MPSAIVVGSGVFGASLALRLTLDGWKVTLVDQYPPGHVRAASGGESRLIRFGHGDERWYTRSAWRARDLWCELEEASGARLLEQTGLVWLAHREGGWEARSELVLAEEGIPCERLSPDETADLFPNLSTEDVEFALLEPEAGILRASEAVRVLVAQALQHGARFVGGQARPRGDTAEVGGDRLGGDRVVWACGAWLPRLFPELVRLRVTQQDVLFFGAPIEWQTPPVPAWVDYDRAFYGHGDLDGRGVKIAVDLEGPPFDPEHDPRVIHAGAEERARAAMAERFPALAAAPLVYTRTCPYALTDDTNFIISPHPGHERVWILGGGSGHGFKHGPALGEYVARLLAGEDEPDSRFGLGARMPAGSLRTAGTGR